MGYSHLLTPRVINEAADIVQAAFLKAYDLGHVKRTGFYIVVMDPGKPFGYGGSFEDAILAEIRWGEHTDTYKTIAREKTEATWEHKMPTSEIVVVAPHLLKDRNTKHGGSAIYRNQIVGCSGVESQMDEAFSYMMAVMCVALCITDMRVIAADGDVTFMRDAKA